jgi:pentatricopeptide repeat protein
MFRFERDVKAGRVRDCEDFFEELEHSGEI